MRQVAIALALLAAPAAAATPEERLAAAGFTLPEPTKPIATYVTSVETGNLLFLSGHGECGPNRTLGKVGKDLTVEQAQAAAQRTGLCMLATMKAALGELSRVKRVVRVLGFVNATPEFTQHPAVINGFSNVMVVAFGDAGKAARAAVGAPSLPLGMAVEVEATVEIAPR
ncbi:MAG: RidA family protein [Alphaproteobacteria bacterium]|nr:RidA family protein [Alphaproteobacteria bacterium]